MGLSVSETHHFAVAAGKSMRSATRESGRRGSLWFNPSLLKSDQ
jgi:hypothetical protein